jgi:hypothetical protein
MIATLLPALLVAAGPSAADTAALDAKVAEIFRPYQQDLDDQASWDYPIWSAEVKALIDHWQRVLPENEPDRLNDGDWLCQCQDWDARGFKTVLGPRKALSPDVAQIEVKIDLGFDEVSDLRDARMIFKREGGDWRLDDIFAEQSFPHGLKQALRGTIAEDEALR